MTLLTRRSTLATLTSLTLIAKYGPARAAKPYDPPAGLVDAARKEGEMVLYTAAFPEIMQDTITLFNKRFPGIKVRMVRASGGQLITRVRTEAANNKLEADILDHSDRAQVRGLEEIMADYAPPNAADYLPETLVSPKIWPTITPGWSIAWNTELVKNPPRTWWDLTKPEWGDGKIGQVIAPSGGTTWTRAMFERQVLGEDYWPKLAANKTKLYPSGAPLSDAVVRGEILVAPLIFNIVYPKKVQGAPIDGLYPKEGIPIIPYGSAIPKAARHPNAARLWMDWMLSDEGQTHSLRDQGNMTALKNPPIAPPGFDPKTDKLWTPNFDQMQSLHAAWLEDWGKAFGHRQ